MGMLAMPEADKRAQAAALARHVEQHFSVDGMVDGILDAYRMALPA